MNTRQFTRVKYSVGASITYDSEVFFCNTGNLSLRGVFLKTEYDLPLNIPVDVTVYHSNSTSLKVNACVVWREKDGVGLQINNLDVDSFSQLRDIVTENSIDRGAILQETYKMLKCID